MQVDTHNVLQFTISDFVGKSVAVLGITGSGKTNTAAVLIEELLSGGLPLTICDIEGEYWGLKEQYEILVAGRSEHAEVPLEEGNAAQLAEVSVQRGISVILDLSEYTQDEAYGVLVAYFRRLWEVAGKSRTPYQIVLEEAHEFVPQGTNTPLKQILTRIALRGRKRGLGIILMSQRSAKVEKDVLTQTALLFLHRVIHPTDMRVYTDLIPLPAKEVEQIVGALQPGEAVIVHNHVPQVAHIRLRHTFHAGATPEFGEAVQPELRRIDAKMLAELQRLLVPSSTPQHNTEARLRKRIEELEILVAEQQATIARQQEQIDLLSKLSVSLNTPPASAPAHLEVEQAHVNHLHVPQSPALSPAIVDSTLARPAALAQPKSAVQATPINEAKVQSLRRELARCSWQERKFFEVLVREEGRTLSIASLAAWLNVDGSTVRRSYIPERLIKRGLVARRTVGNGYHYRAALRDYLAREFPGADIAEVQRRVLS